jgi:tRNA dimethylallyltransferase
LVAGYEAKVNLAQVEIDADVGRRTLPKVVVIAGATATGKSALALAIAREFGGVLINADALQVYSELKILSARPGEAELALAPHRLYGILSARERCSAGRWRALALAEIEAAHRAQRLPILAGGTGLYLKALVQGLAPIPEIPAAVRANAVERLRALGAAAMQAELAGLDPWVARLGAGDTQRLVRAYEVFAHTGRPLGQWLREPGDVPALDFLQIVLERPRAALYSAIDRRFEQMLEAGALGEVAALLELGLPDNLPAMKAVGVRELAAHCRGEIELAEAAGLAKQASRRYAKRQMTWFRKQMLRPTRVLMEYSESFETVFFPIIRSFQLTDSNRASSLPSG